MRETASIVIKLNKEYVDISEHNVVEVSIREFDIKWYGRDCAPVCFEALNVNRPEKKEGILTISKVEDSCREIIYCNSYKEPDMVASIDDTMRRAIREYFDNI